MSQVSLMLRLHTSNLRANTVLSWQTIESCIGINAIFVPEYRLKPKKKTTPIGDVNP